MENEHDQLIRLQEQVKIYHDWLFVVLPKVYNQTETEGWIVMIASQQSFKKVFGEK